jgi:hypothetical protein
MYKSLWKKKIKDVRIWFKSTIIEVMSEEHRYLLLKKLKGRRICHAIPKYVTLM